MTTPNVQMNMITRLPLKIAQKILFYLSPEELRTASSCYPSWKAIIRNDSYWKKVCQDEGYFDVEESQRTKFYDNFIKKYNYWQGVYWYNCTLRLNWEKNCFKAHFYKIRKLCDPCWFFLDDVIFAFKSLDETKLYVYNLRHDVIKEGTLHLKNDVNLDYEKIWKNGRYIIQFIQEKSLTVWDSQNYTQNQIDNVIVFEEFWDYVTNVKVFKNLFLLECKEKFQVLNIETKQIEYEYKGIFERVYITDGRIVYSTKDHSIHVLKWEDKSLVTFTCGNLETSRQHKILVTNDILIAFCITGELIFLHAWNITTKTKLYSKNLGINTDFCGAFLINKYLCIKSFQSDDGLDNLLEKFQLLDYKKGIVEVSVTDLDSSTTTASSNGLFILASRSRKLGLWCLKKKDFLWHLNFLPDFCWKVRKTKLALNLTSNERSPVVAMRCYEV